MFYGEGSRPTFVSVSYSSRFRQPWPERFAVWPRKVGEVRTISPKKTSGEDRMAFGIWGALPSGECAYGF